MEKKECHFTRPLSWSLADENATAKQSKKICGLEEVKVTCKRRDAKSSSSHDVCFHESTARLDVPCLGETDQKWSIQQEAKACKLKRCFQWHLMQQLCLNMWTVALENVNSCTHFWPSRSNPWRHGPHSIAIFCFASQCKSHQFLVLDRKWMTAMISEAKSHVSIISTKASSSQSPLVVMIQSLFST